jgi:hypothetical protein
MPVLFEAVIVGVPGSFKMEDTGNPPLKQDKALGIALKSGISSAGREKEFSGSVEVKRQKP